MKNIPIKINNNYLNKYKTEKYLKNNIIKKIIITDDIFNILLENILSIIHQEFIKEKINYTMICGTLLGAIRHKKNTLG